MNDKVDGGLTVNTGEYNFEKTNGGESLVSRESLYGTPLDITNFVKKGAIDVLNYPPYYPKIDKASIDFEIFASTFPKEGEGCLDLNELNGILKK